MAILIRKCLKPDPVHRLSKDHFLYLSFQLNVEFLKPKTHRTPLRTRFNLLGLVMCIGSSQVIVKDQAYLPSSINFP